jgi:hypothetical protein
LHGDDTTVPVLAKGKTDTGRCWVMCATIGRLVVRVRRRRCFITPATAGEHPQRHLAGYAGLFQADAFDGCDPAWKIDPDRGVIGVQV